MTGFKSRRIIDIRIRELAETGRVGVGAGGRVWHYRGSGGGHFVRRERSGLTAGGIKVS
ncbi:MULTISPECIES: hypothetical protein [unclassified Sphingomonas]|uniref:hypothetical protein n=1 Tax=unclassified Sphingomonas TaxID=196159 RepID=UPI00226AEADD|nr:MULTISPECIES: hypothetical protein [unclassified Sphingomonas]